ncbi:MAG: ABC transporter permease [Deltaproteobacteria bacterium]|nr:ABC transporter permease [Deltaproteobacteria bacterium]
MFLVAVVGMTLAVATLFVALSLARGFEHAYRQSLLGFHAHVVLLAQGEVSDATSMLAALPERVHGLTEATPFLYREGLFIGKGSIKGVVLKGIDLQDPSWRERFRVSGNSKGEGVILGKAVFPGVDVGETVKLLIPKQHAGQSPFLDLAVAGTFSSGLYDSDSQFALIDLEQLRKLFGDPSDVITGIELFLDDPERAQSVAVSLEEWLPPTLRPVTWQELNAELFEAIRLEKTVLAIIMGMLVLVAALNIIAVVTVVIHARTREMAILSTLGISRRQRMKLLMRLGFTPGLWGTLLGLSLGIVVAFLLTRTSIIPIDPEVYLLDRLLLDLSPLLCGIIGVFSLGVTCLVAAVASQKLVSLPIIEGLRQAR